MPQQAKRPKDVTFRPSLRARNISGKADLKVVEASRGNIKKLMHTTDGLGRAAAECTNICSGNLEACIESGNKVPAILQKINEEMLGCCSRSLSDASEISQDVLRCHTVKDVIDLPGKAFQCTLNNYFDGMSQLTGLLFNGWNEALEPLRDRTAVATRQFRKALAT